MPNAAPSVTICVVPRERFSCAVDSLRDIARNTATPFEPSGIFRRKIHECSMWPTGRRNIVACSNSPESPGRFESCRWRPDASPVSGCATVDCDHPVPGRDRCSARHGVWFAAGGAARKRQATNDPSPGSPTFDRLPVAVPYANARHLPPIELGRLGERQYEPGVTRAPASFFESP